MTKLSQLVAITKTVKANANRSVSDFYKDLQKASLFSGIVRTYSPLDDEGDQLPSESTLVQLKAPDLLARTADILTRAIDVALTRDVANTVAKADVKVGGTAILNGAPIPFLLGLEKELTDLYAMIFKLPTLDPSEEWHLTDGGVYATTVTQSNRTKKVPRNHVKAPATDKHPAQVEMFFEDVIVGRWSTTKLSGAVTQDRKAVLLARVEALREAVKFAREEANSTEITNQFVGEKIFAYILAD